MYNIILLADSQESINLLLKNTKKYVILLVIIKFPGGLSWKKKKREENITKARIQYIQKRRFRIEGAGKGKRDFRDP